MKNKKILQELDLIKEKNTLIERKQRISICLISFLFSFFFISAPLAICINLYLFEKYYYLISVFISLLVSLMINLYHIIYLYLLNRLTQKDKFSYYFLYHLIESIIISLLFFIILSIMGKVIL